MLPKQGVGKNQPCAKTFGAGNDFRKALLSSIYGTRTGEDEDDEDEDGDDDDDDDDDDDGDDGDDGDDNDDNDGGDDDDDDDADGDGDGGDDEMRCGAEQQPSPHDSKNHHRSCTVCAFQSSNPVPSRLRRASKIRTDPRIISLEGHYMNAIRTKPTKAGCSVYLGLYRV